MSTSTCSSLPLRFAGALLVVIVSQTSIHADAVTAGFINSDDLVIPVFDSDLGTLNTVSLSITVRSGATLPGGGHDHSTYPVFSSNVIETAALAPFAAFSLSIDPTGNSNHFAPSPSYSGGGLNFGPFNLSLFSAGFHGHSATVSFAGMQQVGFNAFRMVASVDPAVDPGHNHSYPSTGIAQFFSGANVSPFLAANDIVIPAGAFSTFPDSGHTHFVPAFSRTVSTAVGLRTLFFSATQTPFMGGHTHLIDPRFDIFATFNFTPVAIPEAPQISAFAILALGCTGWTLARALILREGSRNGMNSDAADGLPIAARPQLCNGEKLRILNLSERCK